MNIRIRVSCLRMKSQFMKVGLCLHMVSTQAASDSLLVSCRNASCLIFFESQKGDLVGMPGSSEVCCQICAVEMARHTW